MYKLTYWKVIRRDAADELKAVRLKSVEEIHPLSLPHNRPHGTDAIILERTEAKHHGKYDKLVWANDKGRTCEVIPSAMYGVR